MTTELKIERVGIDTVHPDPGNARVHPPRNLAALRGSLARFGQQKPIVVDGNNVIRAGNGTWQAAKDLGWAEIAVVRTGLDGTEATAFSIADNRTSDLSLFDPDVLNTYLDQLKKDGWQDLDLEQLGFGPEDLLSIERMFQAQEPGNGTSEILSIEGQDDVPEPSEEPVSRRGDLWILGDHRLLCGDSTKAEDLARLMAGEKAALLSTDPPYCVDYTGMDRPIHDGKPSGKDWSHVYREIDIEDSGQFMDSFFNACLPHVEPNAMIYIWHADLQRPVIVKIFELHDLLLHQIIVWVKPTATFGHGYYRWRHEPCAFGWRRGNKPEHGHGILDTVWEVDWEGKSRVVGNAHPTQKPVRLFEIPMEQHTRSGAVILEPFSGSGSQIIAAEKLGRKCRAMEIQPAFVDVAVERWEKITGKIAVLDGTHQETFSEVEGERRVEKDHKPWD